MKLTGRLVKAFEADQKRYGTHTALFNVLWMHANEDLTDLGVTRVRTENGTKTNSGQARKQKAGKAGRNGKATGRGRAQESVRKPSQGPGASRSKAKEVDLGYLRRYAAERWAILPWGR